MYEDFDDQNTKQKNFKAMAHAVEIKSLNATTFLVVFVNLAYASGSFLPHICPPFKLPPLLLLPRLLTPAPNQGERTNKVLQILSSKRQNVAKAKVSPRLRNQMQQWLVYLSDCGGGVKCGE